MNELAFVDALRDAVKTGRWKRADNVEGTVRLLKDGVVCCPIVAVSVHCGHQPMPDQEFAENAECATLMELTTDLTHRMVDASDHWDTRHKGLRRRLMRAALGKEERVCLEEEG